MKNSNLLTTLAVIVVITTLLTLIVTVNKIGMTGKATDTATANFTINSAASISFITNVVNWGSGSVDEIPTAAYLYTNGTVVDGTWNSVSQGLTLQNDGNVNVTVSLTSSKAAADFVGGTNPEFKWLVSENESNSCSSGLNPTSWTAVSTGSTTICSNMSYDDSKDALDIDLMVKVPEDAIGTKGCVITATGTAI